MVQLGAKTKAQIAMEFLMIFGVVLVMFLVFLKITHAKVAESNEKKDYIMMQNLADDIRNEVILATQVHDNYIRRFQLPLKINGEDYKITLEEGETEGGTVKIELLGEEEGKRKEAYATLPVSVLGGFADRLDENSAEHCITKNKGEIRIARNQASVEIYKTRDDDGDGKYDLVTKGADDVYQVTDSEFYAYMKVNCVDNLMGIQFTISYDSNKLDYNSYSSVCTTGCDGLNLDPNPLFNGKPDELPIAQNGQEITFGFVAQSGDSISGYGNIARIKFNKAPGARGIANINIVPNSLIFLDTRTGAQTTRGLPSSIVGADVNLG